MTAPSLRDIEQLSAFLDGQLSQAEKERLENRLKTEPGLAVALAELRQTKALLRRVPRRLPPRNFTLTPHMAGVRPPAPRLVPALSWASAVAMLLFVFTLGGTLLEQLPLKVAVPMMAAAPRDMGGGPEVEGYGGGGEETPLAKVTLVEGGEQLTPSPERLSLATPEPVESLAAPGAEAMSAEKISSPPINPWLLIWPALALFMLAAAFAIRWAGVRKFRKKTGNAR